MPTASRNLPATIGQIMSSYKEKGIQRVIHDVKENPNDGYNIAKIQIACDNERTKWLNISPKTLEAIKKLMAKEG